MKKKIMHYPSLKTVLMVENTLKKQNNLLTREQLKQKLPKKIMHQTLNVVLSYLESSGKIMDGRKGILWIYNPSPKLEKAIKQGIEL
jgi:hypothetical protein